MRHSTVTAICFALLTGIVLLGTSAFGLESLSDEALDSTHAARGIRIDLDNVQLDYSAKELGFEAHDNLQPYWSTKENVHWDPTPDDYRYGKLFAKNVKVDDVRLNGSCSVEFGPYAIPLQEYAVRDTWKHASGSSVASLLKYVHDVDYHMLYGKTPDFNVRGRNVLRMNLSSEVGNALEVNSLSGDFNLKYSESGVEEKSSFTQEMGRFSAAGLRLVDQQMILYPLTEIPMYKGSSMMYAAGDGLAFELGIRMSIDYASVKSPGYQASQNGTTLPKGTEGDLVLKGIHLRESFQDSWILDDYAEPFRDFNSNYYTRRSDYDFFGKITTIAQIFVGSVTEIERMYWYSTRDPGGYQAGDEDSLLSNNTGIMESWRGIKIDPDRVDNMYGGRFMLGNLQQVSFIDYVSGNNEIPKHTNHSNQIDAPGMDDNGYDKHEGSLSFVQILERPGTISFKRRSDGSSCVAMNLPVHGSIRIEDVTGYNSSGDNSYLGGNSMGSVVIEGLRVKKLYLEFPGRNEEYVLQTKIYPRDGLPSVTWPFRYRAGKLPVAQPISPNQHEMDSIGRGVKWYMDQLGPVEGPNAVTPGGLADQYVTRLGGDQFGAGKSYWKIQEHLPNSAYTSYVPD